MQCHGEINDPIFRFGSLNGRAISVSMRERFSVSESVLGYSQRERIQHFFSLICANAFYFHALSLFISFFYLHHAQRF